MNTPSAAPPDCPALPPTPATEEGRLLNAVLARPHCISIRGARTHNLKNINIDIPREQLVVITGLSGSGKSSLAFDTLYAEGQRRYVESLSTYARQFLGRLDKPEVDSIEGLSPAIAIEQKATSHNPRSTVGTVTEIHDYLRLLYARVGTPYCPEHGQALAAQTISQMVDSVLALPADTRLLVLAPMVRQRKGAFNELFQQMQAHGYVRFRINGQLYAHEDLPVLKKSELHDIDVVIDRIKVRPEVQQRLAESLEAALRVGGPDAGGRVLVQDMDSGTEYLFSSQFSCPACDYALPALEPRLFSFNAKPGACPSCDGLGQLEVFDVARIVVAPECSLADGAIAGWGQRSAVNFALLKGLAQHYQFDLATPFNALPTAVQQVVLHGSGTEAIAFEYVLNPRQAQTIVKQHPFEGVLPNLARRWRDTSSGTVREELARWRSSQPCPECHGARLRREARHVKVGQGPQARTLPELNQHTLAEAQRWFSGLQLSGSKADIAAPIVREVLNRLQFLNDVGLGYLSLDRHAASLSGGEAQRIRLASQIGSGLSGVMYVLDEPSIGLHQRDNDRLIATLQRLRDLGNSVIVVEHDQDMMRAADHVIDLGPGAGEHGGQLIAQGNYAQVCAQEQSLTGQYLAGKKTIPVPAQRPHTKTGQVLCLLGAHGNNLRHINVDFPVGLFTCVTGVSGSGKSTLVNDTLYKAVARQLYRAHDEPAPYAALEGIEHFDKVISVDQSPIGRTPRSNPATYTGLFTPIRELMAQTHTARERGYDAGRFSFNVAGGRCEACQGDGVMKVEMHFLPDVYVPCEVCHGLRYNRETLEVQWKGRNIAQILQLTVEEAYAFFKDVPSIARKLQSLLDVGLGYIRLGQSATTLSGGEAQRVKLAQELSKRDTGRTLYILDEPTTGLHFADITLLLQVLHQLRDAGNTIVVIEHNLDVIKTADWLIDIGPEAGTAGGTVVAIGTPEAVAQHATSHTGRYLKPYLSKAICK